MSEDVRDLPSGWCRDAQGVLRRETIHSMLRRMVGWDYRQRAIYEITVVLTDRASSALGRLEVRVGEGAWVSAEEARTSCSATLSPREILARVVPSELGATVARCWEAIPRFYPQVKILAKQVMPDHFHGILFVTEPLDCHLGQVIKGFKTGCNKAARELGALPSENGLGLFADGFNDSILFRDGQLGNWFHYLADNPRRLALKLLFSSLFKNVRELAVPLSVGAEGRTTGRFSALGNLFLLERPLAQVQVSRRDFGYRREPKPGGGLKICRDAKGEPIVDFSTALFDEKREELFAAAKHGAVLISPCVSDGERQIAREALAAGFRLVTLQNKGFSKLQKPSGRAFDACVEGRLLMLAPSAWPYQPGEKPMTRSDAVAMNRLCQWLAGSGAAEINYHGMQPTNIDQLARAAAQVQYSTTLSSRTEQSRTEQSRTEFRKEKP